MDYKVKTKTERLIKVTLTLEEARSIRQEFADAGGFDYQSPADRFDDVLIEAINEVENS